MRKKLEVCGIRLLTMSPSSGHWKYAWLVATMHTEWKWCRGKEYETSQILYHDSPILVVINLLHLSLECFLLISSTSCDHPSLSPSHQLS